MNLDALDNDEIPRFRKNFGHTKGITVTVLFGQNDAHQVALQERKAKMVKELEELLAIVAERGHPGMIDNVMTLISHPEDLAIADYPDTPVGTFLLFEQVKIGREVFDIVLYRRVLGREAAFGLYNGRFVDPAVKRVVCVTMRPTRFVEQLIPSSTTAEELEALAEPVDRVILSLRGLFAA